MRQAIDRTGLVVAQQSQEQFRQFLTDESARLRRLIDACGLKISVD